MAAKIGLGIVLAYESITPGVFTPIGEIYDFKPADVSVDTVDTTNHSHTDGFKRFIAALGEYGEASASLAFDPQLTVYATLKGFVESRSIKKWKVTFPTVPNETFDALITGLTRETPLDDKMTMDITLKISGIPTWSAT